MAEHRHHHGKPDESGQRADQQQRRDDQAPQPPWSPDWPPTARTEVGIADRRADIAIDQQRERHDADDQRPDGEAEADQIARRRSAASRRRGEDIVDELADRTAAAGSRTGTGRCACALPSQARKMPISRRPSATMAPQRRRAQHVEGVGPVAVEAGLAAAAQFVEADRGDRTDQGKARRQREQQRQHAIAERQPDQENADQRIDQAQEDGVARHGREIVPALWPGRRQDRRSRSCGWRELPGARSAPTMTWICAMVVPPSALRAATLGTSGRLTGRRPSRRDPG